MRHLSKFGSSTRAVDGCIVTFEKDGERWQRHFNQIVHTVNRRHKNRRKTVTGGDAPLLQAINYADANNAKIICISSPETIYRDLQGTRDPSLTERYQDGIAFPERPMLGKFGRLDLWVEPRGGIDVRAA